MGSDEKGRKQKFWISMYKVLQVYCGLLERIPGWICYLNLSVGDSFSYHFCLLSTGHAQPIKSGLGGGLRFFLLYFQVWECLDTL